MRIRSFLPLLVSTIVAVPAAAGDYGICLNAADSVSCLIEQAEFTRLRNAEIDASIARVARARAQELALSLTHCKSPSSETPRCLAERERYFAEHQNALIEISMIRVAEMRAFEAARNAEIAASLAAVEARQIRELEMQQKIIVEASLAAVAVERQRRFAAQQNALATASVERVAAERSRQLALQLAPCTTPADARPVCETQRALEFAAQQNALALASLERVKAERERAFAAARNAEIASSIAAVERARESRIETASICQPYNRLTASCTTEDSAMRTAALAATANTPIARMSAEEYASFTSHCVRSPESPSCEAERIREFAAARNAEIAFSIAAVQRARESRIETASICQPYNHLTAGCTTEDSAMRSASLAATANGPIARMSAEEYAALTSHCVRSPESPRCEAERIREIAAARNAETNASIARMSAEEYASLTSHCVRSPESPRCEAERIREFAAARNAEVERSLAAVAVARANGQLGHVAAADNAATNNDVAPLETGAIGVPSQPTAPMIYDMHENPLHREISTDACSSPATSFGPVDFVRGSDIETDMKPELDRLAQLVKSCPGMRIEVRGHATGGSRSSNRSLSEARAQAVADYLVSAGVTSNRVAAIGRAGRHLVQPHSNAFDPAYVDRAELVIRSPGTDAVARRVMWDLAELLDPTYIPPVANLSP